MSDLRVDITVESSSCGCGPGHSGYAPHWPDCAVLRDEQARSFAYGNAAMSNPRITREMIDRIQRRLNERPAINVTPTTAAKLGWFIRLLVRLAKWTLRRYAP